MSGGVAQVVRVLLAREDELFVIAQNLIEFWAVATRLIANNGLGLTIAQAALELTKLKDLSLSCPTRPTSFQNGSNSSSSTKFLANRFTTRAWSLR